MTATSTSGAGALDAFDAFFADRPTALRLAKRVRTLIARLDGVDVHLTKSEIAFVRGRQFAWLWTPDRWLHGDAAPLVLSVALAERDASPRWKQVNEARGDRTMHHVELRHAHDVDDEIAGFLERAWRDAPRPQERRHRSPRERSRTTR